MPEIERPTEFSDVMRIARELTVVDQRSEAEVYLDVARRLVQKELEPRLKGLPISDEHKRELIDAETYSAGTEAHRKDVSVLEPTRLLEMLERLGAFDFDCRKHCERRSSLIVETGIVRGNDPRPTERTPSSGMDKLFIEGDLDESLQQTICGEVGGIFLRPTDGPILVCKTSPDCQEDCPVPEPTTDKYEQVVATTVDLMIERGW